jgi:hypothetical protein
LIKKSSVETVKALNGLTMAMQTMSDLFHLGSGQCLFEVKIQRGAANPTRFKGRFSSFEGEPDFERFDFIVNFVCILQRVSEFLNFHGGPPVSTSFLSVRSGEA